MSEFKKPHKTFKSPIPRYCECGCQQELTWNQKHYKHGHVMRVRMRKLHEKMDANRRTVN